MLIIKDEVQYFGIYKKPLSMNLYISGGLPNSTRGPYIQRHFPWLWGLIPFMYLLCLAYHLLKGIWSVLRIIMYVCVCAYVCVFNKYKMESQIYFFSPNPLSTRLNTSSQNTLMGCWEILEDKVIQFNLLKSKYYASVFLH